MGRASVCVGGDESVAAPAAAVPDPVPDRPTRATRKTQASSIDTLYGVEDIRELRSLIPTYEHPPDEARFISSVLETIPPFAKLAPVLFGIAVEAHKGVCSRCAVVGMILVLTRAAVACAQPSSATQGRGSYRLACWPTSSSSWPRAHSASRRPKSTKGVPSSATTKPAALSLSACSSARALLVVERHIAHSHTASAAFDAHARPAIAH